MKQFPMEIFQTNYTMCTKEKQKELNKFIEDNEKLKKCIREKGDLKKVAKELGLKLATPV